MLKVLLQVVASKIRFGCRWARRQPVSWPPYTSYRQAHPVSCRKRRPPVAADYPCRSKLDLLKLRRPLEKGVACGTALGSVLTEMWQSSGLSEVELFCHAAAVLQGTQTSSQTFQSVSPCQSFFHVPLKVNSFFLLFAVTLQGSCVVVFFSFC